MVKMRPSKIALNVVCDNTILIYATMRKKKFFPELRTKWKENCVDMDNKEENPFSLRPHVIFLYFHGGFYYITFFVSSFTNIYLIRFLFSGCLFVAIKTTFIACAQWDEC